MLLSIETVALAICTLIGEEWVEEWTEREQTTGGVPRRVNVNTAYRRCRDRHTDHR